MAGMEEVDVIGYVRHASKYRLQFVFHLAFGYCFAANQFSTDGDSAPIGLLGCSVFLFPLVELERERERERQRAQLPAVGGVYHVLSRCPS